MPSKRIHLDPIVCTNNAVGKVDSDQIHVGHPGGRKLHLRDMLILIQSWVTMKLSIGVFALDEFGVETHGILMKTFFLLSFTYEIL